MTEFDADRNDSLICNFIDIFVSCLKLDIKVLPCYNFRNVDPPVWYDTNVKLFEIQRV